MEKNFYFIVPVDDEHLKMEHEFKDQLKREGCYGEYCISGIISSEAAKLPIDVSLLPIHGSLDLMQSCLLILMMIVLLKI